MKYADGKPSQSKGSIIVKLSYENRKKIVKTYQEDEVDSLIVYLPKIDRLCMFPPNIFIG